MIDKARAIRQAKPEEVEDVGDHVQAPSDRADASKDATSLGNQGEGSPAMPTISGSDAVQSHRDKMDHDFVGHLALVPRPIGPSELKRLPDAIKKVEEEWDKLRGLQTWIESCVCE